MSVASGHRFYRLRVALCDTQDYASVGCVRSLYRVVDLGTSEGVRMADQVTPKLPPKLRSAINTVNAHKSWAKTPNRTARTAAGRAAALDRFEKQVDPDGVLDPVERAKRAENAKTAFFREIALKSAAARAARKAAQDGGK